MALNQVACPHCRGVISGEGIAPGQTMVCPHCGRQFLRPGAAAPARPPAPQAAAAAPRAVAPAPMAVAAPSVSSQAGAGGEEEAELTYAQQYAEERQAQSANSVVWIVLSVLTVMVLLAVLGFVIYNHKQEQARFEVETMLVPVALDYAKDNAEEVSDLLGVKRGTTIAIKNNETVVDGDVAWVYLSAKARKGSKRINRRIVVKFVKDGDQWRIEGRIRRPG